MLANFVSMRTDFCVPLQTGIPVKNSVIASFFLPWVKIVLLQARKAGNKIGFLDFSAGPGRNADGSEAAPVLILRTVADHPEVGQMFVSVFTDKDPKNVIKLRQSVAAIEGIGSLQCEPQIEKAATYEELVSGMKKIGSFPSIVIIDPFSVKDLNLHSLCETAGEWNFDYIFLFHYNQLEKIIDNPFRAKYLDSVFGKQAADRLRTVSDRLNVEQKERFIVSTFLGCLRGFKGSHAVVLKNGDHESGSTQFLVFVSKYVTRYRLMKEVLAANGYIETNLSHDRPGQTEGSHHSLQTGLFTEAI